MRYDHEERILRNPVLTARAFWHFATSYGRHGDDKAPQLPHFILVAAMMFHHDTVDQTFRMQFSSGLSKALDECPDMLAGLQFRLDEYALDALKGLQVACAARILERTEGSRFPAFRAVGVTLPSDIREDAASVGPIFASVRRFGRWFASEDITILAARLKLEF